MAAALAHAFGIVLCPLHRFCGVPCPTCGTTRAAFALARGDFAAAFALNPLTMSLLCFALPPIACHAALRGADATARLLRRISRSAVFWTFAVLAIMANWLYLLTSGVAD